MNIKLQYKRKLQLQQKPHHTKKCGSTGILMDK